MNTTSNALRSKTQPFRDTIRTRDIHTWLARWRTYGACTECHQPAGAPCLNLDTKATNLHLDQPHPHRPTSTESTEGTP